MCYISNETNETIKRLKHKYGVDLNVEYKKTKINRDKLTGVVTIIGSKNHPFIADTPVKALQMAEQWLERQNG